MSVKGSGECWPTGLIPVRITGFGHQKKSARPGPSRMRAAKEDQTVQTSKSSGDTPEVTACLNHAG